MLENIGSQNLDIVRKPAFQAGLIPMSEQP
jgi:hypothetical protein